MGAFFVDIDIEFPDNAAVSYRFNASCIITVVFALWISSAATAQCVADLNDDNTVGVPDLLAVINGWGPCPPLCPPSCAADIVQNCTVGVPDLLAVINAWGPCPCAPAGSEPNDDCNSLTILPNVGSNQTQTYTSANLHSGTDVDIYRFRAQETDSSCSCCDGFCTDEDYRVTVRLTVPITSSVPFQLCSGLSCGAVTTQCINVGPGQMGELTWILDGGCFSDDTYDIFLRIRAQGADVGCVNYVLSYEFEPGCF